MKILFVGHLYATPSRPFIGLPNAKVVTGLRQYAEVAVIAPQPRFGSFYPPLPLQETDFDGQIVLHPEYLHVPKIGWLWSPRQFLRAARSALTSLPTNWQPDAVLGAWAYPDGVAACGLAEELGIPSVVRVMGSDINEFGNYSLLRRTISRGLNRASAIICVSQSLADATGDLGVHREKLVVVPTGIDTHQFHYQEQAEARHRLGLNPGQELVVMPSRLSPEKGPAVAVEAIASLVESGRQSLQLRIFGEGRLEAAIRQQLSALGLRDRILIEPFIAPDQLQAYYCAADLCLLPSLAEGWPNTLVESLACGCPFVASDVGGVPEIHQQSGQAGVLCPPSDAQMLACAIEKALDTSWDRRAIAQRASEQFSLEKTIAGYLEVLTRAITA